jgi:hypothetical protein
MLHRRDVLTRICNYGHLGRFLVHPRNVAHQHGVAAGQAAQNQTVCAPFSQRLRSSQPHIVGV